MRCSELLRRVTPAAPTAFAPSHLSAAGAPPSAVAELGVVRPMTRAIKFAAAALLLCGALLIVALLGGIHNSRFSRYHPISKPTDTSESDFTPSIHPMFSEVSTPRHQTVIPYLFYRHSEPDRVPHIYLNTTDNTEQHGYRAKRSVTINSLTVRNSSGSDFALITPSSPRTFSLLDSGYGSSHEDLGGVSGDVLHLTITGFVVTDTGERKQFSHDQRWQRTFSTRTDLGIGLAE